MHRKLKPGLWLALGFLIGTVVVAQTVRTGDPVYLSDDVTASKYFNEASVTQTNTALSFGFNAREVCLINNSDSANEAYFDLTDTTATTSEAYLLPGETYCPDGVFSGVGLIAATGETASVRVLAYR